MAVLAAMRAAAPASPTAAGRLDEAGCTEGFEAPADRPALGFNDAMAGISLRSLQAVSGG
jgi:hypothetical protein